MKSKTELLGMLGLAARARALVIGEADCLRAIRSGQVKLVFLATDAGANGAKKMLDKCTFYHVQVYQILNKSELGQAIGRDFRTVVGVTHEQFAHKLAQLTVSHGGGEGV